MAILAILVPVLALAWPTSAKIRRVPMRWPLIKGSALALGRLACKS